MIRGTTQPFTFDLSDIIGTGATLTEIHVIFYQIDNSDATLEMHYYTNPGNGQTSSEDLTYNAVSKVACVGLTASQTAAFTDQRKVKVQCWVYYTKNNKTFRSANHIQDVTVYPALIINELS